MSKNKNKMIMIKWSLLIWLTGCSTVHDLRPEDIRDALNNCVENRLNTLVYKRADGSVLDIRCVPRSEDMDEVYKIRSRKKIGLMRGLW